jgi:uncharacterized metal-binding protein
MDFSSLYNNEDKKILKVAEDTIDRSIDRIQEIIEYAKDANLKKIGIAYCTTFAKETIILEKQLLNEGFQIEKVHCKLGRVPFSKLLPGYKGITCNPAGQANYLHEKSTELNIMMGLCVGHDMIFNSKSKAPVTPLVVKDRKLKHHTLERLKNTNPK